MSEGADPKRKATWSPGQVWAQVLDLRVNGVPAGPRAHAEITLAEGAATCRRRGFQRSFVDRRAARLL